VLEFAIRLPHETFDSDHKLTEQMSENKATEIRILAANQIRAKAIFMILIIFSSTYRVVEPFFAFHFSVKSHVYD
jgi:hypothetical protein